MEVTMLRDALDIGMRVRLDNLTIEEKVYIEMLIEDSIKEKENYLKVLDLSNKFDSDIYDTTIKKIELCKNMLSAMENKKVVQVDCYNGNVEQESFATIVKKYKKIK